MVEDDFTFVSYCDNDKVGYEYFIWVKKKKIANSFPWQSVELVVQDDPTLSDDSGEVPKSEWRGWRFDSRLWNLLSTWQKDQAPTPRKVGNCSTFIIIRGDYCLRA